MATQADIRDFISMVTGGLASLQELIVAGRGMGLNVQDTVEIVANLQPNLVPNNIMTNMNAPSMVDNTYTAPRIGFDEAVTGYGVQEEPQTGIFQEKIDYYNRDGTYDTGVDEEDQIMLENALSMTMDDPTPTNQMDLPGKGSYGGRLGLGSSPTNQIGLGSMSMSDIINSNLQASQAEIFDEPIPTRPIKKSPPIPSRPPPPPMYDDPRTMGSMGPPRVATDPINYGRGYGGDRKKPLVRPPIQVDIEPQVPPTPPTPVNFSYGDTQTGMMDAAATLRSPFTSSMDRQAAQDYMSGIVSNIRLPF